MIRYIFRRPGGGLGRSSGNPDQENGTTIDDVSPPPYDVAMAEAAEAREKEMTFKEARKADKRLIWYSLGFSGTIIMEGYGLALITYLFSFAVFKARYGQPVGDSGDYEVRPVRRARSITRACC